MARRKHTCYETSKFWINMWVSLISIVTPTCLLSCCVLPFIVITTYNSFFALCFRFFSSGNLLVKKNHISINEQKWSVWSSILYGVQLLAIWVYFLVYRSTLFEGDFLLFFRELLYKPVVLGKQAICLTKFWCVILPVSCLYIPYSQPVGICHAFGVSTMQWIMFMSPIAPFVGAHTIISQVSVRCCIFCSWSCIL